MKLRKRSSEAVVEAPKRRYNLRSKSRRTGTNATVTIIKDDKIQIRKKNQGRPAQRNVKKELRVNLQMMSPTFLSFNTRVSTRPKTTTKRQPPRRVVSRCKDWAKLVQLDKQYRAEGRYNFLDEPVLTFTKTAPANIPSNEDSTFAEANAESQSNHEVLISPVSDISNSDIMKVINEFFLIIPPSLEIDDLVAELHHPLNTQNEDTVISDPGSSLPVNVETQSGDAIANDPGLNLPTPLETENGDAVISDPGLNLPTPLETENGDAVISDPGLNLPTHLRSQNGIAIIIDGGLGHPKTFGTQNGAVFPNNPYSKHVYFLQSESESYDGDIEESESEDEQLCSSSNNSDIEIIAEFIRVVPWNWNLPTPDDDADLSVIPVFEYLPHRYNYNRGKKKK